MYNKLLIFRNELKSKEVYKYKLIGIVIELIFSKQIFLKNLEMKVFLKDVFGFEAKDYVFKSRTLVIAKVSKLILKKENYEELQKKLLLFINKNIEYMKNNENIKDKKNQFDGWL